MVTKKEREEQKQRLTKALSHGTITITDFYGTDYVDYSSYDNLRKIASVVDGQKNASRKVLCTVLEKNIRSKLKVSQLASKVAEFTEYLHGDISGVVVTLGRDFPGSNNLALLQRSGNFGTRLLNDASAPRYIHSYGKDVFFELFKKEDSEILRHQYFEGQKIEPMFYVPSLPIILINGSDGVSSGFAQKILPRDPAKIKQYVQSYLSGKGSYYKFEPYFEGFKGTIEQGENSAQWLIKGVVKRLGINRVEIQEVPIGYDLKSYLKVLDNLVEKKIIQGYRDKSEDDFKFEVTIASKDLKVWSDDDILEKLKLVKKVTENYTVIDDNNKILVLNSPKEIIEKYFEIKLKYLQLRKDNNIKRLEQSISVDESRYHFIEQVVNEQLIINKRKKADIEKDLAKISKIITIDNSYDYLLKMPMYNLTLEKMQSLLETIKENKAKLKRIKTQSVQELWLDDF